MLPSSVRRVVTSSAAQAAPLASAAAKSAAAVPVVFRGHQRRYSSSKPSRPDNGSSEIAADQSVPASSSSARADGKTTDKRRRKNKDLSDRDGSFKKLPSVPSTHHISQEALGLSSFFSLHRPISITQTMPRTVSDEHFASIFAARSKANRMAETMSALTDTIDQLEGPMASVTIGGQEDQGMQDGLQRVEFKNPDGSESSLYVQVDTMSGDFLPFRPPPTPQPQMTGEADAAAGVEVEAAEEQPLHRVYKAMFTIEESTEPNGQVRIVAHSPSIVNDEQPRSFLERLAQRQLRLNQSRGRGDMHSISVRRQRKLKMKKQKYKKLMKKTRNLRRKLDRT